MTTYTVTRLRAGRQLKGYCISGKSNDFSDLQRVQIGSSTQTESFPVTTEDFSFDI